MFILSKVLLSLPLSLWVCPSPLMIIVRELVTGFGRMGKQSKFPQETAVYVIGE